MTMEFSCPGKNFTNFFDWAGRHGLPMGMNSSWDPRVWNALGVYFLRHFQRSGKVHWQLPTWELFFTFVRGEVVPLESVSDSLGASSRDVGGRLPPRGGPPAPPATAGGTEDFSRTVPTAGLPPCAEQGGRLCPRCRWRRFFLSRWSMCMSSRLRHRLSLFRPGCPTMQSTAAASNESLFPKRGVPPPLTARLQMPCQPWRRHQPHPQQGGQPPRPHWRAHLAPH